MASSLELMRQKNKARNLEFLQSLQLDKINNSLKDVAGSFSKPKADAPKKRMKRSVPKDENEQVVRRKSTRLSTRMSNTGEESEVDETAVKPPKLPKPDNFFGAVPKVPVGTCFETRMECSRALVHRPPVAGIHGNIDVGCYSLALSGEYSDDVDNGDTIIYTGAGGRDLKGTKAKPKNLRTAAQTKDQSLTGNNLALAMNVDSKKPVRVIRGYKLQSAFAPTEGYRYDGLYSVEKYWPESGKLGFLVYKYLLKRCADQEPAPWDMPNDNE